MDRFTSSDTPGAIEVESLRTAILDGVPDGPFPLAQPTPRRAGVTCLYANPSHNGRIPHRLPSAAWGLRWHAAITHARGPDVVLAAGDRLVVATEGFWELFDHDGRSLHHGATASDRASLDARAANLWGSLPTGLLVAHDLSTGARRFVTHARSGMNFVRTHLDANHERALLVSLEAVDDVHEGETSRHAIIERVDLGDGQRPDASGFLPTATLGAHVIHDDPLAGERPYAGSTLQLCVSPQTEPRMLAASSAAGLTLATFDRVYLLDEQLGFRKVFTDAFEPVALSIDERGRTHLAVHTGDGDQYWCLDAAGVRVARVALPEGVTRLVAPPIVGYNHTAYLVAPSAIMAVHADGRTLWTLRSDDDIVGALIAADGHLLVTTRHAVFMVDAQGASSGLLGVVGDETFTTAATLTEHDTLVVATRSRLLCYEPEIVGERTLTTEGFSWSNP